MPHLLGISATGGKCGHIAALRRSSFIGGKYDKGKCGHTPYEQLDSLAAEFDLIGYVAYSHVAYSLPPDVAMPSMN